jgi:hypothetical protein
MCLRKCRGHASHWVRNTRPQHLALHAKSPGHLWLRRTHLPKVLSRTSRITYVNSKLYHRQATTHFSTERFTFLYSIRLIQNRFSAFETYQIRRTEKNLVYFVNKRIIFTPRRLGTFTSRNFENCSKHNWPTARFENLKCNNAACPTYRNAEKNQYVCNEIGLG